jgi:hypothetical protein
MRRTAVALGLAVLLATLEAPAHAQVYPPDPKPISIDRSVVNPGDTITVSGEQADAGAELSLQFFPGPRELATTTAGADGRWSVEVTIPADAGPGKHALSAVSDGDVLATAVVEVRAPAGEVAGESTSSSSGGLRLGLLALGVAAVAIGIAVVLLVRRQRDRLGV